MRLPKVLPLVAALFLSAPVSALTLNLPPQGDDVVGETYTVKIQNYEDTLTRYAEVYGVGFRELLSANPGVNPWVPGQGREVLIPSQFILPPGERKGIVINLAEMRMFYYPADGKTVVTFPIGIGREGWQTPLVSTTVTKIVKDPGWTPPASIRAEHAAMGDPLPSYVPPGPDNPLGPWALRLAAPGYLIHGSNKELGVGMRVSHGCMRMYNNNVAELAAMVPVGTTVRIINSPVKVGWKGGAMYVEVHEALEEQRSIHVPEEGVADAIHIANRISSAPVPIDWVEAKAAAVRRSGLPVKVSSEQIATR
jgi:L,D-transpeptidase ErfK/SrfK